MTHSFPTRRSSDLEPIGGGVGPAQPFEPVRRPCEFAAQHAGNPANVGQMVRQIPVAVCRIRSEEHTSELQSLMRISYAVFCLKKKQLESVLILLIMYIINTHNHNITLTTTH